MAIDAEKEIQEMHDRLKKLDHQENLARIAEHKKQLEQLNTVNRRRVTRRNWLMFFLPLFSGEKIPDANVRLAKWIDIAGSPQFWVDIVDEKGVVIGSVPPVSDPRLRKPIMENRREIGDSIQYVQYFAEQRYTGMPEAQNGMLWNALMDRFEVSWNGEPGVLDEVIADWKKLLVTFGKEFPDPYQVPIGETATQEGVKNSTSAGAVISQKTDDDLEY